MAYRVLEVTLHSARDLKNVNFISRMEVYAVATISGDPLTSQSTPPDPYGGRHPSWNATLHFTVPAGAGAGGCLHVLLRAERALGDRDIGEVIVPLSEILSGGGGGPYVDMGPRPPQFASYQVRKVHRPEPRGVLHLSYRLGPVVAPPPQIVVAPPHQHHVVDAFPVSPPYEYLPPPPESYLAGRKPPPSPPISKPPPPPATRPAATGEAAVGHVVAGLPAPVAAKADRLVTSTPSPVTSSKADWQVARAPPPPESRTKGMRNNNKNGNFEFEMGLVGGMMTSDVMCDAAVYNAGYRAGLNDRSRAVY
uniref:C2 domain-containing protein n=1 Tax=Leersia perrieri TaxID=77586 RepID=A0A0D9X2R6_9ORYZ